MSGASPIDLTSPSPGLTQTIPSYLYEEYADDDDLQGFVEAQNQLTQQFVNWFCQVILPVYNNPNVNDGLLDWIARGIYGYQGRPQLPAGSRATPVGPYATTLYNQVLYGYAGAIVATQWAAVNDDIFRRILTWNMYRGDGPYFTPRWLKRRIMRFLFGPNGTDTSMVAASPQVSVSYGLGNEISITFLTVRRKFQNGALYGAFLYGTRLYEEVNTTATYFSPLPNAATLKAAIDNNVCVLPFIYKYIVVVQTVQAPVYLWNNGGVLMVLAAAQYPTTLPTIPGAIWSNGGVVQVVPGVIPNPAAPPLYFGITAEALLNIGGGNLPLSPGPAGSGQLWNNGDIVMIS